MSTKKILDEAVGWYGTFALVIAYGLLSFQVLNATDLTYQLLNGTGALCIVYISFKKKAYPPAVLNIIWAIIAIIAMVRIFI